MQSEQKTTLPDCFGQHTKGYNTSLSLCCTPDNFTLLLLFFAWMLGTLSLWSSLLPLVVKWDLMWARCCTPCLRLSFKELRNLSCSLSLLNLIYQLCLSCRWHSYTAAKELLTSAGRRACACDVFVLFRERERRRQRVGVWRLRGNILLLSPPIKHICTFHPQ